MAKKTKTPGPWPLTVVPGDKYKLTVITNQGNHYASTFDPSAARLIAAAPELLEACKNALLDWERGDDISDDDLEKTAVELRAAIAQVEGLPRKKHPNPGDCMTGGACPDCVEENGA